MNYYERHIGDWVRDTTHLSMTEDGAYSRLTDVYYAREKPLPADLGECCKLARCKSKAERVAVKYVLAAFFDLQADGYHQKRTDAEILRFQAKSSSARASANARWSHSERNANASGGTMRTHSDGIQSAYANDMRTTNGAHPIRNALQSPVSTPQSPSNPLPPYDKGVVHNRRSEVRAEKDAAAEVWQELVASNGARPQRDPKLQAALDRIGGWSAVQMRTPGDEPRLRSAFCEAYAQAEAHA